MELPFLVLLSTIAILFFWLGEKNYYSQRLALKIASFILILIISILVTNEGFSTTTGVTPPVNQTICAIVQNCTNGVNSTCTATNSCSYSYGGNGQLTITKFDIFTQGFALILQIFALYILITEGWYFIQSMNKGDED